MRVQNPLQPGLRLFDPLDSLHPVSRREFDTFHVSTKEPVDLVRALAATCIVHRQSWKNSERKHAYSGARTFTPETKRFPAKR